MTAPVYILGGFQTDFARNWTKEGKHIAAMIREAVDGVLAATDVAPKEIDVGHVGNFAAELYAMHAAGCKIKKTCYLNRSGIANSEIKKAREMRALLNSEREVQ